MGAKDILTALDIFPHLLSNFDGYASSCLRVDNECNPEALIEHRFRLGGLEPNYFPRTFFTCAAKGDTTRWMPIGKLLPEGVHMKYPGEYKNAIKICNANKEFKRLST